MIFIARTSNTEVRLRKKSELSMVGMLGDFAQVLSWLSHFSLGFAALGYMPAIMLMLDGATNHAQIHAIDSFLKEKGIDSKDKVYEALRGCQDEVIKHLAFWSISLHRTWGAFQVGMSGFIWWTIFGIPVHMRAAPHFIVGLMQIMAGLNAAAICYPGFFWGTDTVAKFGSDTTDTAVVEVDTKKVSPGTEGGGGEEVKLDSSSPFPRPVSGVKADFIMHQILGFVNIVLGVLCIFLEGKQAKFSPPL